ncbi:MAG: chalcone isomerase family protein [Candidatus Rokubacteria bacterium]|nr:chalcone isomerase family protein [Candidatus Rokubacteria bacterium]
MKAIAAALIALSLAVPPAAAQEVTEPGSGVRFAVKRADLSLLGVGLRTRTWFKVKVYAIALYVADSALSGPLAVHKGALGSPAFYKDLIWGDFAKEVHLKFTRDVDQGTIQDAMREALAGADKARIDTFVGYFPEIKAGQECVIRWVPGGTLETVMAGKTKPPIADRDFVAAVFAVWLGEKAIQEDIKKGLVSRAPALIK